jgi:hypothetical protein
MYDMNRMKINAQNRDITLLSFGRSLLVSLLVLRQQHQLQLLLYQQQQHSRQSHQHWQLVFNAYIPIGLIGHHAQSPVVKELKHVLVI